MHIRQTNKHLFAICALALTSFLLSACAGATAIPLPVTMPVSVAAPAASAAGSLEGSQWLVTEYRNQEGTLTAPIADATLMFADGRISGNMGCNNFFAGYTVAGGQLTIEQAGSTMMACPEDVMAQEQALLATLGKAAAYAVVGGQLHIFDANGTVLLAATAQAAPSLTGGVWQATNYNNGNQAVVNVIDGTKITAVFDEKGNLSGSAGCNNYITSYSVDGNKITIQAAASTMMLCAEPEGIMEQEQAYLAALATAATWSISADILEMRTADDALALRFQVASDAVAAEPEAEITDLDPVAADIAEEPAVALTAAAAQASSGRVLAPLGVNVRIGPGTQYPILGIAPLGTQGEIIGKSEDGQWWVARVPSAPDQQGWVAAAHIGAENVDNVPVIPTPPLPETSAPLQTGQPYPVAPATILYSASRVVQQGNRVYELEDIYAVPATPGSQAQMVANNAMQPALSPDRKTLALHSLQSDKLGLGGYDVDTGRRLRFSAFVEDSSPRWSPSGDRLVFASNRQGDRRWRIYTTEAVDHENPANMRYVELGFGKDPDWHPSQDLIIFKGCDDQGQNCGTYTMNADGSNRTAFTNEATDSMPRWLPDGSGVVFMSEGRDGNWEIYRKSNTDGSVTRLTNDPAPDGLPAVSPDGQQIAFVSKRGGTWGVWVMPAAGGDATKVADIAGELPDWLSQSVDWPR